MVDARKSLVLILLCALGVALSACGSDDGDEGGGEAASGSDAKTCLQTSPQKLAEWCDDGEKLKIAVVLGTTEHSFYNTLGIGASEAGDELGVDVEVQGAKEFSPAAQAPVLNAVIQSKPDALIVALTSPTALNPQLKRAAEEGIVVFTADNDTEDASLRWTNVGTDHVASGEVAAQTMATAITDAGEIGLLGSSPGPLVEQLRLDGFKQGMEGESDIKVLETEYCAGDPARCASTTSALISGHPDLKGIFGVGEPMGVGAGNGVRSSGKQGEVVVGSFDASPAQQRDLKEGVVDMLVVQHPKEIGYEAVNIATQALQGKEISSPVVEGGATLDTLPEKLFAGFAVAVKDEAMCPESSDVDCGTADDSEINQWFYVG